ncbi:MAG: carboxypeptidase regulatory-like domain-containing protein [Verrucomicrobiales bacterium]|nr:carboxypeptidase regulatory-like domain-containing protein [Verrucomicrobiales bacterium]MCP5557637.1 carboxypeptidase regulatory-like domain-containing protein [Verrucomicrobiaceae bacterium]
MNSLGLSLSFLALLACITSAHADGTVQGSVSLDKPKPPAVGPGYKPETQNPVQNEEAPRAIVYLENASGKYPKKSGEVLSIRQQGYQFRPSFAVIQTGGAAEFPNRDDEFHNVFSYSRVRRFDLGRFRKDEPSPRIDFDKPGLVKIYCEIHQHMRCLVLVVDTPWYTTTDAEGAFTLPKVPSGDYTLKALLPSEKTLVQKITVRDGAVTKVAVTR